MLPRRLLLLLPRIPRPPWGWRWPARPPRLRLRLASASAWASGSGLGGGPGAGRSWAASLAPEGAVPEEPFVFPEYEPEPEPGPEFEERLRRRLREQEREREREERRRRLQERRWEAEARGSGGPGEPGGPASGVHCSGCGAELQCGDPGGPGYLPAAKYEGLEAEDGPGPGLEAEDGPGPGPGPGPGRLVCRRCWLLVHHRRALRVRLPPGHHRQLLSDALRRPGPALLLYVADLLDLPDAFLPGLPKLLGPRRLLVLGNKVDLLPGDSAGYLRRLRDRLGAECARAGLGSGSGSGSGPGSKPKLPDVLLISAKTGYGVEELISTLQRSWRYRGDVYLVGATNAGKSTLFNTLLQSDYCTAKGAEAIDRATISPWPGTTLNLLKFPISNPTPYRMFKRHKRLKEDAAKAEEDLSKQEQKHLNHLKKCGYLVGRVGKTFHYSQKQIQNNAEVFEFDADSLAFSMEPGVTEPKPPADRVELTPQDVKDAHWFYDTPGIMKENCVLNLLTDKEVKLVLPTHSIIPRTYMLKPGMVLFLGALGRIDYLQGSKSAWFSVMASNLLPVHITTVEKADAIYQKHAGQALLQVPMGGTERMSEFPPLIPQDLTLEGNVLQEAVADIKLSSAGWVAITVQELGPLQLRGHVPGGCALTVRQPPLLPHIVNLKGERIKKSVAYKTKKPPALVSNLKSRRSRPQRDSKLLHAEGLV